MKKIEQERNSKKTIVGVEGSIFKEIWWTNIETDERLKKIPLDDTYSKRLVHLGLHSCPALVGLISS
jgi:predicted lipase